jgi:subtilisin family serine protease
MLTVRRIWGPAVLMAIIATVVLTAPRPTGFTDPHTDDPAVRGRRTWNLDAIGAPDAWQHGRGHGSVVAVLDSGIATDHPDLRDRILDRVSCVDTAGDSARCAGPAIDHNGHGTHVAGIIAAEADNGQGIAGVAPEAKLLAVQVLTDRCVDAACTPGGSGADVAAGIRWSVDHGADVVNLSLASTDQASIDADLRRAVVEAWDRGVVVVAAAGNDEPTTEFTDLPVIVVTGLDRSGRLASYSQGVGDARWALAAPGGQLGDTAESCRTGGEPAGVLSTWWEPDGSEDDYACLAGTSMAAPHVSGAAAILLATGLSAEQTVHRLLDTATDLGDPGPDRLYGAGALDVARAVDPDREVPRGAARYEAASDVGPDRAVSAPTSERDRQPSTPRYLILMCAGSAAAMFVAVTLLYRTRSRAAWTAGPH